MAKSNLRTILDEIESDQQREVVTIKVSLKKADAVNLKRVVDFIGSPQRIGTMLEKDGKLLSVLSDFAKEIEEDSRPKHNQQKHIAEQKGQAKEPKKDDAQHVGGLGTTIPLKDEDL